VRKHQRLGDQPVAALTGLTPSPLAVLMPEGGFAEDERAALLKLPNVVRRWWR